ncbi:MAG: polyprenyl synthetase family protein [Ruminococcaceae bacterium]|nr:polyprenyl synthetase family protein [Oscillospiraceae bacterium]
MNYEQQLSAYTAAVNGKLRLYLDAIEEKSIVSEAMAYSLMNAGKRVRPVLALAFCEMLGGDVQTVLPYACALEMIHTYSLIHDDLPCVDNDDLRRGKPSCHKVYGEAYALFAGDALLNFAFEVICGCFGDTSGDIALECAKVLAKSAGIDGMLGGQTRDKAGENTAVSLEELKKTDALKTGALIIAPCLLGVIAAGGSAEDKARAENYGAAIGLQFQIVDDILDVTGSTQELGKCVGSDTANSKSTYVSLLGLEQARQQAETLANEALAALAPYGEKARFLTEFTRKLTARKK